VQEGLRANASEAAEQPEILQDQGKTPGCLISRLRHIALPGAGASSRSAQRWLPEYASFQQGPRRFARQGMLRPEARCGLECPEGRATKGGAGWPN
jgi:hypothetical protein